MEGRVGRQLGIGEGGVLGFWGTEHSTARLRPSLARETLDEDVRGLGVQVVEGADRERPCLAPSALARSFGKADDSRTRARQEHSNVHVHEHTRNTESAHPEKQGGQTEHTKDPQREQRQNKMDQLVLPMMKSDDEERRQEERERATKRPADPASK